MNIIRFFILCVACGIIYVFSTSVDEVAAQSTYVAANFTPVPYYLEISSSGDCGNDLEMKQVENSLFDFNLRTGCLDQWRGAYKGRARLEGREMKVNDKKGSIIFKFDSKGVNVIIKNCTFKTIEGSSNNYKIGQTKKIDNDEFYIPIYNEDDPEE